MPPLTFIFNHDLWILRRTPGHERILAHMPDGRLSPMGCGWNVLSILGIVTRERAQAEVDAIAANPFHQGLTVLTMADILRTARPADMPLVHRSYARFPLSRDPQAIQQLIIDRFFPTPQQVHIDRFCYVILKLVISEETGLGHTILLAFQPIVGGVGVTHTVHAFDVQLNRYNGFETFGTYLSTSPANYIGVSSLLLGGAGGKKLKPKKKTHAYNMKSNRKTKRENKKVGGQKMMDPEMVPMNKKDETAYLNLMKILETEKYPVESKPFYYPVRS
jgi:hypothetical protein